MGYDAVLKEIKSLSDKPTQTEPQYDAVLKEIKSLSDKPKDNSLLKEAAQFSKPVNYLGYFHDAFSNGVDEGAKNIGIDVRNPVYKTAKNILTGFIPSSTEDAALMLLFAGTVNSGEKAIMEKVGSRAVDYLVSKGINPSMAYNTVRKMVQSGLVSSGSGALQAGANIKSGRPVGEGVGESMLLGAAMPPALGVAARGFKGAIDIPKKAVSLATGQLGGLKTKLGIDTSGMTELWNKIKGYATITGDLGPGTKRIIENELTNLNLKKSNADIATNKIMEEMGANPAPLIQEGKRIWRLSGRSVENYPSNKELINLGFIHAVESYGWDSDFMKTNYPEITRVWKETFPLADYNKTSNDLSYKSKAASKIDNDVQTKKINKKINDVLNDFAKATRKKFIAQGQFETKGPVIEAKINQAPIDKAGTQQNLKNVNDAIKTAKTIQPEKTYSKILDRIAKNKKATGTMSSKIIELIGLNDPEYKELLSNAHIQNDIKYLSRISLLKDNLLENLDNRKQQYQEAIQNLKTGTKEYNKTSRLAASKLKGDIKYLQDKVDAADGKVQGLIGKIGKLKDKYYARQEALKGKRERLTVPANNYITTAKKAMGSLRPRSMNGAVERYMNSNEGLPLDNENMASYISDTFHNTHVHQSLNNVVDALKHESIPGGYVLNVLKDIGLPKDQTKKLKINLGRIDVAGSAKGEIDAVLKKAGVLDTATRKQAVERVYNMLYRPFGNPQAVGDNITLDNPLFDRFRYSTDKNTQHIMDMTLENKGFDLPDVVTKLNVGLKSFMTSISPFHARSLIMSSLFSEFPSGVGSITKGHKDLADIKYNLSSKAMPLLNDLKKQGYNIGLDIDRPIDFTKFYSDERPGLQKHINRWLWDKLYTVSKLDAAASVADKYNAGYIDAKTAARQINQIDTFYGGNNVLRFLTPGAKTALRNAFLSMDWQMSLIKQLGYAMTAKDIEYAHYWANIIGYNFIINNAFSQAAGNPNILNNTDFLKSYINDFKQGDLTQAVHDIPQLFTYEEAIGNNVLKNDVMGYEAEWPKMLYHVSSSDSIQDGIIAFMKGLYTKTSPAVRLAGSLGQTLYSRETSGNKLRDIGSNALPFSLKSPESIRSSFVGITQTKPNTTATIKDLLISKKQMSDDVYKANIDRLREEIKAAAGRSRKFNARQQINNIRLRIVETGISEYDPNYINWSVGQFKDYFDAVKAGDKSKVQSIAQGLIKRTNDDIGMFSKNIRESWLVTHKDELSPAQRQFLEFSMSTILSGKNITKDILYRSMLQASGQMTSEERQQNSL